MRCNSPFESRVGNNLHFVEDGEELMDYCTSAGNTGSELRAIPVIVLTTSKAEEDIVRSYDLGASGFISKPVTFEGLVDVMKTLGRYWFHIVELPQERPLS
jgi:CheY-like chemotaxis protein